MPLFYIKYKFIFFINLVDSSALCFFYETLILKIDFYYMKYLISSTIMEYCPVHLLGSGVLLCFLLFFQIKRSRIIFTTEKISEIILSKVLRSV